MWWCHQCQDVFDGSGHGALCPMCSSEFTEELDDNYGLTSGHDRQGMSGTKEHQEAAAQLEGLEPHAEP